MSLFLGQTTAINTSLLQQTDDRTSPKYHQWDFAGSRSQLDSWANGMLWPSSKMGVGGTDGFLGSDFSNNGRFESDAFDFCGGAQVKKLIGMTLDSTGTPLGSCIVQGFLTATDIFVGQTTSDSGGYYELPTSYSGQQHYVIAYKAGAPDVAGTTVNTLVPT